MTNQEPRIKSVECGICDHTFTDGTVFTLAKRIAKHWNDEHGDECETCGEATVHEVVIKSSDGEVPER